MKVGINGFGRIGKNIYRVLVDGGIEVPLVNEPFIDLKYMEYLLRYDSVYGRADCRIEGDAIVCNGLRTLLSGEKDPSCIQWQEHGVDYVVESSGVFTTMEACQRHNCRRVVLSAPSDDIPMFVYGVNHTSIGSHRVISAASCTTNCLAPLAKLLHDEYGIEEGLMTTVHSMTASQRTTDSKGGNWRSARSCMNIIPATTGAARAVGKVLPELDGRLTGMTFRVPVLNVSVVDLVVRLRRGTSLAQIRQLVECCGMGDVIGCTEELVVSSDLNGDTRSSILDVGASIEMSPTFFKLISWYDNEHGYSNRVVDLIKFMDSA